MIYWIIGGIALTFIAVFGYMAYKDEKEIDDDLRKADSLDGNK